MLRKDARRRSRPLISGVAAIVAAVVAIGGPATAAPTVGGAGSFEYDESSPAVNIGAGITIAGGGDYGGTYIEFAVEDATSTEVLSFPTSGTPSSASGAVSVVGSSVYLGNGTGADVIGRVDPVLDGTAGKALRVHFDVDFANPSFESGDLTGWTALNQQINLGVTQIAGCTTADTVAYPTAFFDGDPLPARQPTDLTGTTYSSGFSPVNDDYIAQVSGALSSTIESTQASSGELSARLQLSGLLTTSGFDVVHGPAIFSSPFMASAGDVVQFDWRAFSGEDAHSVFGYMVNTISCVQTEILDSTASTFAFGASTPWSTASAVVPVTGTYRFVFVAGTFDLNGGRGAGASLFVDNVRVHGPRATDAVVQDLARLLHYRNTSFSAPATRSVTVVAEGGSAGAGTITVEITPTPEMPVLVDQTLASASVGTAYADGVNATGWPAATYSVTSGALPPGLTLHPSTGAVTGTPTAGGSYELTITATNVAGSVPIALTLHVSAPPSLFVDGHLGSPTVGASFVDGILTDGSPAPTYSISAGTLPAGLTIDSTSGVISGIPSVPGQAYSFTVLASNAHGSLSRTFSGVVGAVPAFDDDSVGTLVAGTNVIDGVHAGGFPSPTYSITNGAMPTGVGLDPVSGAIVGTPTSRGQAFRFTVTASNSAGSISRELTGTVLAVPVIDSGQLGTVRVGRPVEHTVHADATPAASFTVTAGTLPAGLSLDSATGVITGVPVTRGSYDVTVTSTNAVGDDSIRLRGEVEPAHRGYLGLTPARVFDSRLLAAKPAAGSVFEVEVLGRGGVPADATAVVLNVAVTEPDTAGFATVYPCGSATPWAANVNFGRGETVSNSVTTAIGADGRVCVYSMSPAHVVVDVNGAFSPSVGAGHLVPIEPARLVDTREIGGRVAAGQVLTVTVAGRHGVPGDATAAVLNVAVDDPSTAGYVTVYPCGEAVPFAANLNFAAGRTVSNAVVADIGAGGAVCVFTTASTDIVVDVDAAYSPTLGTGALTGVTPERVFDSRADRAPLTAGAVQQVAIGGRSSIPAGSVAVALNVAVTESATAGYVTAYPCGGTPPWVANLTFAAGQTVSNAVTVSLGSGGRVCFVSSTTTHLVVDVNAVHVG